MIRTILKEAWTLNEAEAEIVHDALGMVQDAVGPELSAEARLDLERTLREVTIFNAPRSASFAHRQMNALRGERPSQDTGAALTITLGSEVIGHLRGALEILADWQVEAENDPEGEIKGLTTDQQEALADLRANLAECRSEIGAAS